MEIEFFMMYSIEKKESKSIENIKIMFMECEILMHRTINYISKATYGERKKWKNVLKELIITFSLRLCMHVQ